MKLTRKSYNRRVFTFGTLIFLSIALISTGFATWVMSTNAEDGFTDGVNVGTITDGQLAFVKDAEGNTITFTNDEKNFRFDAREDDKTGDIKTKVAASGETLKYENLKVQMAFIVGPVDYLEKVTVQMTTVPAGIMAAAGYKYESASQSYSKDSAMPEYIVLPECATKVVEFTTASTSSDVKGLLVDTNVTDSAGRNAAKFTYTIEFGWGAKFGGINPGFFLDDESGVMEGSSMGKVQNPQNLTYAQKKAEMINFRCTMFQIEKRTSGDGWSEEKPFYNTTTQKYMTEKEVLEYNAALSYEVQVIAVAN